MIIKTLFENRWVSLKMAVDKENSVNGYVFSHETRCDGNIVTILPFRKQYVPARSSGDHASVAIDFYFHHELTPCWTDGVHLKNSFTGGVENDDPVGTAVNELREEAGITVGREELIGLGTCRAGKSSDSLYHLFAVDISDKEFGELEPDSELEKIEYSAWSDDIDDSPDPMVYVMYHRLKKVLGF